MNLFESSAGREGLPEVPATDGYSAQYSDDGGLHRVLLPGGEILYHSSFLSGDEATRSLEYLTAGKERSLLQLGRTESITNVRFKHIDWRQETISMWGKTHLVPRLTAWHGDPGAHYEYSKISQKPGPWNSCLRFILEKVEAATQASFNSVLLNWYRDGDDHLGWHADDEPELGDQPTIASISVGAPRDFVLRRNASLKEKLSFKLAHGSLVVMRGDTQQNWQHSVPKRKKCTQPRINLTFRLVSKD